MPFSSLAKLLALALLYTSSSKASMLFALPGLPLNFQIKDGWFTRFPLKVLISFSLAFLSIMHCVNLGMQLISCDISEADSFFPTRGESKLDAGCILKSWVRTSTYTHTHRPLSGGGMTWTFKMTPCSCHTYTFVRACVQSRKTLFKCLDSEDGLTCCTVFI